ncbi:hypothetical protein FHQ18_03540 [Deferribacter autotrophicus]|uniref:SCP2 sterol-binding domain-containing protein n=1 Tax=Deferribacter autotrophicus TaxID=500465 RepID=A0A5A8F656_9BACT|nr:hypothetical protein [Deferribacter autotrophicus]KAA0259035.1 hypothetical protein FHQ18_03540 [Deferribacter autotrophicus]
MEKILEEAKQNYKGMEKEYVYYFVVDDTVKKTVFAKPDVLEIEDGKVVDNADCVCKISSELFKKIWYENYKPGMKEIFSGELKTNSPDLLQKFLKACK